jgi:hypothetical protein
VIEAPSPGVGFPGPAIVPLQVSSVVAVQTMALPAREFMGDRPAATVDHVSAARS